MLERINQSVGRGGVNARSDVLVVQRLLNKQIIPGVVNCLLEDGIVGKNTIARIELFQKHIVKMIRSDGRIDPHGKSLRLLSTARGSSSSNTGSINALSFGEKGKALLKTIEKLALNPYDDKTGKEINTWTQKATIGYGHLISSAEWEKYKDGITESAAELLFLSDLDPFVRCVKNKVKVALKQNEFDALVILAFNIGDGAFATSSVLKLINDPATVTPYSNLEMAWKAWNRSDKKENRGLKNRRQAEWDIYSRNVYRKW